MGVFFWSVKGGVGVTTTAAACALINARRGRPTLLVDFAGDAFAALGAPTPSVGFDEWLLSDAPSSALDSLVFTAAPNLTVLPSLHGVGTSDPARIGLFAEWSAQQPETIVVDVGRVDPSSTTLAILLRGLPAFQSVLVTRPCYLALRRAVSVAASADGVVAVREEGRSLNRDDIEAVLSLPLFVEITADPAVARAVDAGLLHARTPRAFTRALRLLGDRALLGDPITGSSDPLDDDRFETAEHYELDQLDELDELDELDKTLNLDGSNHAWPRSDEGWLADDVECSDEVSVGRSTVDRSS